MEGGLSCGCNGNPPCDSKRDAASCEGPMPDLLSHERTPGWPWWRFACAVALPWVVGAAVAILGAPSWATFGFGVVVFLLGICFAAVCDAIREAGRV